MTGERPSVVIVEPNYLARDVFVLAVRHLLPIADVRDVSSGEAALVLETERPAQLYIISAELPGMSGVTLIETLRARGSSAKIVGLTVERATLVKLSRLDITAAYLKPILLSELIPIFALF